MLHIFLCIGLLLEAAAAQQVGSTPEVHPKFRTHKCSNGNGCITQNTSLVLDYFWRNVEDVKTGASCLTDSFKLNKTICSTIEECARRCALNGANYTQSGVLTSADNNSVTLQMFHHYDGAFELVSPQVYLLDEETEDYVLLQLLNQEVSFDIDVSKSPCGVDAAAYLTGMDASGGRSKLNPAGAAYGTGYCDSQCWDGWPFINGVANVDRKGVCCNEMDLWEANARATQTTAHPCNVTGLYACSGEECSWHKGVCDRSGCGFNPYTLGAKHFYGEGGVLDTRQPFKVVTQFLTDDGNASGVLTEVRRLYIQNGRLIHNADVQFEKCTFSSLSMAFCDATAKHFAKKGGLRLMGEALKRGMVLVLGIWDDTGDFNNWLDSGEAGPCDKKEGKPATIKKKSPGTSVTFSDIKWGDIGSTY